MRNPRTELPAIIAIIAVVTALVCPLFAGMENPYTAKCAANGKQIANALMLYMSEYDGRFPSYLGAWPEPARQEAEAYLQSITWTYTWDPDHPGQIWNAGQAQWRYLQLKNYVKDDSVWVCPYPRTPYAERYAYGFRCSWLLRGPDNWVDGDRGFCDPHGVGRTIEQVEMLDGRSETACGPRSMPPHKKIMAMCYALGEWGNNNVGDGQYPWVFPSYSHEEGTNFAYVDGHVAWAAMGRGWAPIGYTKLSIDLPPTGEYSVTLSPKVKKMEELKARELGGAK